MRNNMPDAMLQEQKRRKRRKIASIAMAWLLVILVIIAVVICIFAIVMAAGGKSLRDNAGNNRPNLIMDDVVSEDIVSDGDASGIAAEPTPTPAVWQEGWVRYNGKVYQYNEDITTILVMGIDDMDKVAESAGKTDGGQNDANFLVIINPDEMDIKILAINRDTMTEINMYGMGENGTNLTAYAQLATQHGFGDGKELSCELTRDAVSALLYDLPIHGYVAVNMGAIPQLNDAIGGVEVTVLEDLSHVSKSLKEGTTVTLMGKDAFWYTKYRDHTKPETNLGRLARQKQYLSAFTTKVKAAVKEDFTLPVTLYQELSKYMVTDITADEVTYLATNLLDYVVDGEQIYTLEGTTQMGEKYEEFYPDKEALKALMIALFYEEVEQ